MTETSSNRQIPWVDGVKRRLRSVLPGRDPVIVPVGGSPLDTLGALARRYGDGLAATFDLTRYEARVFSQNGEDGVIAEILTRIGTTTRWFVEFGASRGVQGNCVFLADVLGWHGLFIEADPVEFAGLSTKYDGNDRVAAVQAFVTPANVEELFAASGVPPEPDVVSIDVDGADWWIWRAVSRYRPRLVVTEYNASIEPGRRVTVPSDVGAWDESSYFGASLDAFEALAEVKGYQLVHTELAGVNAFWVREDLVGSLGAIDVPRRRCNYGLVGGRFDPPRSERVWVEVDDVL